MPAERRFALPRERRLSFCLNDLDTAALFRCNAMTSPDQTPLTFRPGFDRFVPLLTNAAAIRIHDKHGTFLQEDAGLRTRPLL